MVGPIGVKKPGALPPDLQEFLQDTGGHGFIIVSFGSYVEKIIPKEKIDMMAAAFAKLKQKVLWRQKGRVSYTYRGLLCATLYQTNYCWCSDVIWTTLIFSRSVCNFKGILTSNGRTCQHWNLFFVFVLFFFFFIKIVKQRRPPPLPLWYYSCWLGAEYLKSRCWCNRFWIPGTAITLSPLLLR